MSFFSRVNPTVRGFAIIAVIAGLVVVLQLEATLVALSLLMSILFVLAIAYFVFLVWRENRADIATWSLRARSTFYGAALLILADIGLAWYGGAHGLNLLASLGVLAICGFSMWRVWRDQRTYRI
jgi:phage shock protein PspC (stress-responsive transcriptional regulator)